jgi:hypothetical protein
VQAMLIDGKSLYIYIYIEINYFLKLDMSQKIGVACMEDRMSSTQ